MVQSAAWRFLPNHGDEDEGLANAGVETFRGSPFPGLARECGQNSLDAAVIAEDGSRRVRLEFNKVVVPVNQIPSVERLRSSVSACLARAQSRSITNEIRFFEQAIALLSRSTIDALQASDSGTTGLLGPPVPGSPFHALVKSTGVSQKSGDSGGSFGIGKNAAYVISRLRTVFYSTLYTTVQGDEFLAQGKAILTSHLDESQQPMRATGYWGTPTSGPVTSAELVPEWLRRDVQGTTVSSIGFVADDDWQHEIAESLIRNFFSAVRKESMTFQVADEYLIDSGTLGGLFDKPEIIRAADARGALEELQFSAALLRCLSATDSEVDIFDEDIPGLGKMRLRLLVDAGLPKRVGFLRNDMLITDSLSHFGDRLTRFALQKDFVAVVEPLDPAAGSLIRSLENPRHDELSAERLDDPSEKRRTIAAFKKLIRWIRTSIQSKTLNTTTSEVALDEMNQFFASSRERERVTGGADGEEHPETILITPRAVRRTPSSGAGTQGTLGGAGGKTSNSSSGGRTSGGGSGEGTGGDGRRGGQRVPVLDPRNRIVPSARGHVRRITFTATADANVRLQVVATGLSKPIELPYRRLDGGPAVFPVIQDQRVSIDIDLFVPFSGPVEIALVPIEGSSP